MSDQTTRPRKIRRRSQVTIPEPYPDANSLFATALATKELVESLAGQRGGTYDVAVTWGELIDLGIVRPDQVPEEFGPHRPK
jgi:hypothetical protein